MDKTSIEKKIKELEELKIKVENKKKEVNAELTTFRYQLYSILEEENRKKKEEEYNRPQIDSSFLDEPEWSGFS